MTILYFFFRLNMNVNMNYPKSYYRPDQQLKRAVRSADIQCAENLIANGSSVNFISKLFFDEHKSVAFNICSPPKMESPLIDSIALLRPESPHPSNVMMDMVDLLLKRGADVNLPCPDNGWTPLMYAADIGNVKCVEKLIEKGANVFTTDKIGDTACAIAIKKGDLNMLKCLIEDGNFDKNFIDKDGRSVTKLKLYVTY